MPWPDGGVMKLAIEPHPGEYGEHGKWTLRT